MDNGHLPVASPRSARLAGRLRDKGYRDSYVATHTRAFLARQMRSLRGQQSQTDFGRFLEKQQTVVSRLEDPNYGKWALQTLFDVARKMDIAVLVRFVDYPTFLKSTRDMSEEAARPTGYDQTAVEEVARGDIHDAGESALKAFYEEPDRQSPRRDAERQDAAIDSNPGPGEQEMAA